MISIVIKMLLWFFVIYFGIAILSVLIALVFAVRYFKYDNEFALKASKFFLNIGFSMLLPEIWDKYRVK